MNRFRKSDSKTHSSAHHRQQQPRLSALNLKLLRRCRIVLVKDLDAVELLRQLPDDDALGAEVRSTVAGLADRARQAAAILDALEMAGDDTFTAFLGVLRDQHRQLHSVLEETRHSLKEEDEDGEVSWVVINVCKRLLLLRKTLFVICSTFVKNKRKTFIKVLHFHEYMKLKPVTGSMISLTTMHALYEILR